MRIPARIIAAAAVPLIVLTACAPPPLVRSDQSPICTVKVVEKFESAAFRPNPLANPISGPVGGAGMGALLGFQSGAGVGWIVTVPLFAAIGAISGATCAAAALAHPEADAKFQAIFAQADPHNLATALSVATAANAPRDACGTRAAKASQGDNPDAIVELEALEMMMGCPFGKQILLTSVRYRVLDGADRRELSAATTSCRYSSAIDFGEWFADSDRARVEVEGALTRTGQRIGELMFGSKASSECP